MAHKICARPELNSEPGRENFPSQEGKKYVISKSHFKKKFAFFHARPEVFFPSQEGKKKKVAENGAQNFTKKV